MNDKRLILQEPNNYVCIFMSESNVIEITENIIGLWMVRNSTWQICLN